MTRKRRYNTDAIAFVAQEVERSLDTAAATNLALLHELVYWFATSSRDLDDLFERTIRERIKARAISLLKEVYRGKPELLARNLKGSSKFTLNWLCYGMERVREQASDEPFPGWTDFAPTILDALRILPEVMAEQIAGMVVGSGNRGPDSWIFDQQKCRALFDDVEGFLKLYRAQTENQEKTPIIDAVRSERSEPTRSALVVDDTRGADEDDPG